MILDGLGVGPCGDAGVGVAFVSTECLLLLFHVYNVCVCVFVSIYSNPSFHMHFYQCFFMLPLAAYLVACRRTASKWIFYAHRMLVSLKK